jgi:crossover junction endodeoxyribonuclease RuvC
MRVLGVDPGSHKTGWGVVDVSGGNMVHVDNGVLFLDDDRVLAIRLVDLAHRLRDVILTHKPDVSVVEDVFVQKGARSALILGQARGACLVTLGLAGLPVTSLTTSTVKLRVTGQGRAGKAQVAEMVRVLLGLPEVPFEDAADALAVAIAGALEVEQPMLVAATRTSSQRSPKKRVSARDSLLDLARKQGKAL